MQPVHSSYRDPSRSGIIPNPHFRGSRHTNLVIEFPSTPVIVSEQRFQKSARKSGGSLGNQAFRGDAFIPFCPEARDRAHFASG
jgi:hypothetical protein